MGGSLKVFEWIFWEVSEKWCESNKTLHKARYDESKRGSKKERDTQKEII
jgi:hypothetical protein